MISAYKKGEKMKVTQLNLYPLKSAKAYGVEQAFVFPQGFNFDREFMLSESDGTFITARKDEKLYQISALPISTGIMLCFNGEQCVARYSDFKQKGDSQVWNTHFPSWIADEKVNQWLSHIFEREVQLRWLGQHSERKLEKRDNQTLSFADSNPILLCSQKSLSAVQDWSPIPLEIARFRANIVIDGESAFAEENWQEIQIGEVRLQISGNCTRCIMITRDLEHYQLDEQAEPFRTLKKYHTNEKGKPIFGIHLVPLTSGVIRVGDKIEVIR